MAAPRAPKERKALYSTLVDSAEKARNAERKYYRDHYEVLSKDY